MLWIAKYWNWNPISLIFHIYPPCFRVTHPTACCLPLTFLLPRRKNGADDQCHRAQSILHPPCAQNPENWSGQEEDLPSCHSLAHSCRDNNNCRKSLERYEQTCSVDSETKTCAAPYPACRDAMVEILGTDLRTNCACAGTAGDFRELFECIEYQRLFWVNPCVGEWEAWTVLTRPSVCRESPHRSHCKWPGPNFCNNTDFYFWIGLAIKTYLKCKFVSFQGQFYQDFTLTTVVSVDAQKDYHIKSDDSDWSPAQPTPPMRNTPPPRARQTQPPPRRRTTPRYRQPGQQPHSHSPLMVSGLSLDSSLLVLKLYSSSFSFWISPLSLIWKNYLSIHFSNLQTNCSNNHYDYNRPYYKPRLAF